MAVPVVYRKQNPRLPQYTSTEIATNRGILSLYALRTESGRQLTTVQQSCSYQKEGSPSGANTSQDVDYDFTAGLSMTIDGKMSLQLPISVFGNAGAFSVALTLYVYKVTGVTETQLATASKTLSFTMPAAQTYSVVLAFDWTITNTQIKAGEKIRLTLQNAAGGASYDVIFIHDPLNVITEYWDGAGGAHAFGAYAWTKQLKLNIPLIIR